MNYDRSVAQDGLIYWRNGVYIFWLASSPGDKNSGGRFKAQWPSCFIFWSFMNFDFVRKQNSAINRCKGGMRDVALSINSHEQTLLNQVCV